METYPIALDWSDVGKRIAINVAKMKEAEEIRDFLYAHLHHSFPTIHLINWNSQDSLEENEEDWKQRCLFIVTSSLTFWSLYTLTVRDETEGGQLVGVFLNKLEIKPQQSEECITPPRSKITDSLLFAVLKALRKDIVLWQLYKTERIFTFWATADDEKYGRRGLAMKLMELSTQFAVKTGSGAIVSDVINCEVAEGLTKLGFGTIKTIDYATFEFRGVKPLADNVELLSQHPSAHLMGRKL